MTKTIGQLTNELVAADVDLENDWIEVEDVSVPESKKIHPAALAPVRHDVGRLLWQWNRTDVSQFEAAAHAHERAGGTTPSPNAATELLLSVVDRGGRLGNALRLNTNGLAGGGVFAVQASELTLPDRYIVVARILERTGNIFPAVYACYTNDDGGGSLQGILVERNTGASNLAVRALHNSQITNTETMTSSGSVGVPAGIDRLGIRQVIECHRQRGDSPADSVVLVEERNPTGGIVFDGSIPQDISGISGDWDGVDMNRFGIGCYEGVNGSVGTADYLHLQVFAHPWD